MDTVKSSRTNNIKWIFIGYFVTSTFLTLGAAYLGWLYFYEALTQTQWIGFVVLLFLIGIIIGYTAARKFQRHINALHLGFLQASKGNLSIRLPILGFNAFDRINYDFNEMMFSLEQRIGIDSQREGDTALHCRGEGE